MLFLFSILIALTILLEVPVLIKQRKLKELLVFAFFSLISIYLGMVQLLDWPFYNPIPELAIKLLRWQNF